MKRNLLTIMLAFFMVYGASAQEFTSKTFRGKTAPSVDATIISNNFVSDSKDGVYNPTDGPAQGGYSSNTYTELGWTDIVVTETDAIGGVTVDYTWDTDSWPSEGSFHLESPAGTSVVLASAQTDGTYSVSVADFNGETMNGTWMLWIEDSYGDGGHYVSGITVTFHTALAHDLSVSGIAPTFVMSGESVVPQVSVYNLGTNDEASYDVQLTDGDTYDETVNVSTAIVSNTTAVIDFPSWTPADGTYTLTATVTLSGDENNANDIMTADCIVSGLSEAYGGNTSDGIYTEVTIADGSLNAVGAIGTSPFPMAEEYNGNMIYRVYNDMTFGSVAPDGTYTALGTLSGFTGTPTGLAWDWDNSMMYVMMLDGSSLANLCTLNMETLALTQVGSAGTAMIIGIDFAADGYIYGPALNDEGLYQYDPADGTETLIGATGLGLNYGQDVSFDPVTGMLYTINCGDQYTYGTYDLATGAFTQIADMGGKQYGTFVITNEPVVTYDVTFNCDISDSIASGYFVEGTDQLWVAGSMNSWTTPGDDAAYELTESGTNDIYTVTAALADGNYEYKYFKIVGGVAEWTYGEWDGGDNRVFTVAGADKVLNDIFGLDNTSVSELSAKGISVYPNPSNGVFTVAVESDFNLEVFDITGKVVNTTTLTGNTTLELNTAGVYFLRFSNEKGSVTQRVIVQ